MPGAARIGIGLNLAATLLVTAVLWLDRALLVQFRDGDDIEFGRIEDVDRFAVLAALIFLVTFIVAIVTFLRWFSRAYTNLATWSRTEHTTGWAIGAWFVPFLNLWRPFKIAEEIAVGSPAERRSKRPRLVTLWWSMLVLSSVIDRGTFRQEPRTLDGAFTQNTLGFVSNVAWLIAGIAVLKMIRDISADQEQRIAPTRHCA